MNGKWTTYNFRRTLEMSHCFVGLALIFGLAGCAILQETPSIEIPASRLSCERNPEMVDGKLETVGIFEASGTIRKGIPAVVFLTYASTG